MTVGETVSAVYIPTISPEDIFYKNKKLFCFKRFLCPFLRPLAKFQRTEGCMMSVRSLMRGSGFMKQIITVNDVCMCALSLSLLLFSMCLCVVLWYFNQSICPSNLSSHVFLILLFSACLNSYWCWGLEGSHILQQILLLI